MARHLKPLLAIFAAILLALSLSGGPASAQGLKELKANGAVGERFDGYAIARDPGATGAVEQANSKRRQIYTQRAAEQGVTPEQVGRVYAQQIMAKAPPGTYFLTEGGKWVRK